MLVAGRLSARRRARFCVTRRINCSDVKAGEIELWLNDFAETCNVLNVDAAIFRRWAQLMHRQADHHLEDALIGATALVFDLTIATRNTADFKRFGVDLINPFTAR